MCVWGGGGGGGQKSRQGNHGQIWKPCKHDIDEHVECILFKLDTNAIESYFQGQSSKIKVAIDKYGNN